METLPEMIGYYSRFSIFEPPEVIVVIQGETIVDFRPTTRLKKHQTIDIVFPPTSLYYINLSRTMLCLKF